MPEGPEVYMNGQLVNKVCKGRFFDGKIVKSAVSKSCEITFSSPKYTITSETRGKEMGLKLQCEENKDNKLRIIFRFGMSGHFKFSPVSEEVKHAHLSFFTQDEPKMALHFVDVRRFGSWEPCDGWGPDRGPDPMFEYDSFRANVLDNSGNKLFNKPICEVLLEQKYFNGVGNYLRSEIMYRAKVPPFTCARTVLEEVKDGSKSPDFLKLCHDVPKEVINLGTGKNYDLTASGEDHEDFDKWLQCYNQSDMDSMADGKKRMVWFKGDPGPMAPTDAKKKPAAKAKGKASTKPEKSEKTSKTDTKKQTKKASSATKDEDKPAKQEDPVKDETDATVEEAATTRPKRGKRKATIADKEQEETKSKRSRKK